MKYKGKAVGYARVSTEGQATDGKGLQHQVDAIREAAGTQRYELLGIYEEVASAASENGVTHRPALQDAASTATREGAVMIVADASRLFRNVQVAVEFFCEHQVKVFSVKDGKILRSKELLRGIAPAEVAAENIGRGTTSALQSLKAQGHSLGNPNLDDRARQKSLLSRQEKACMVVETIAAILQEDQAHGCLSLNDLADLLNRRGVLNARGQSWTKSRLFRPRKAVRSLIAEQLAVECAEEERELPLVSGFGRF
jgi:DNA invertase Pin-like site-specific DNA recombinase